jgi:hypothetical protein
MSGRGAAGVCELLNGENCGCKRPPEINGAMLLDEPDATALARRAHNGAEVTQIVAGVAVIRTRSNHNLRASEDELSRNSLLQLRIALKGQSSPDLPLPAATRNASIEAADVQDVYTDFRGRTWQMRSWPLADQDMKVVSLGRQLADGYVVLMATVPTAVSYGALLQLKFVSNLVYVGCESLPAIDVAQTAGARRR